MSTVVRRELPRDQAAIRWVHESAFATAAEADLVDELRRAGRLTISLVAELGGMVVGHVALSPVSVAGAPGSGLGLAPVAVHTEHQRTGIGSQLVRTALAAAGVSQVGFVVVLGEPSFYSRFGFEPASNWNLIDEYQGGPAFQAVELIRGAIPIDGGLVRYAPEFSMFGP